MVDVAKLVFEFDATSAATAEKQIDKLAAASDRLQQAAKRARDSMSGGAFEQATRSAGAYEQSLKSLVGAYQQGRDALGRFTGADGAFQMSQAATARLLLQNAKAAEALAKEQDRAAKRIEALTRAYDPLQAEIMATNRLTEEAIKLQGAEGAAVEGLRGKLKSLEAAHSGAAGAAKLQTYQLLNLGRQGADVFVSLASGQALWMVAVQQGAQIGEVLAEAKTQGVGLKAALAEIATQAAPIAAVVLPLTAMAGVLAIGVDRALDNERAVRKFTGQLALNADGLKYNATALAATSRELSAYGVGLEDAQRGLSTFMKEGVDATRLKDFSVASKNLADVIGGDLKTAQDSVSKAFTGGMDAVDKLDQELKFLTASQRAHISAMYDAGQASAAQAEAFRIFSEQVDDAANKARGPWEQSVRDLSSAWSDFLDNLSETGAIRGAVESLQILMNTASAAFRMGKPKDSESAIPNFLNPDVRSSRIKGLLNPVTMGISALGLMGDVAAYQDFQKSAVQGVGDLGKSSGQAASLQNESTKAYQRILGALDEQLANAEKVNGAKRIQLAGENAVNDAISKGVKVEAQLNEIRSRAEAVARVSVKRDEEAAARRAASATNRALREDDATLRALDQAKRAELTAQIGLTKDIEVIAGLKKQAVDTELADRVEALKRQDGMNKINGALIPSIKAALEQEAAYKKAAIDQQLFTEQLARRRAVEDTVAGFADRQAQAQAALANTLEQAQTIENKAIADRQKRAADRLDFDLFMEWADGKKTAAEVSAIQSAAALADAADRELKARQDRLALFDRDLQIARARSQNALDILDAEKGYARSSYQAALLDRKIEEVRYAARRDELTKIIANASIDEDKRKVAAEELATLKRIHDINKRQENLALELTRAYADAIDAFSGMARSIIDGDVGGSITGLSNSLTKVSGLFSDPSKGLGKLLGQAGDFLGPVGQAVSAVTSVLGAIGQKSAEAAQRKLDTLNKSVEDLRTDNKASSGSIAGALEEANRAWNADLEYTSQMVTSLRSIDSQIGSLAVAVSNSITTGNLLSTSGLGLGTSGSGAGGLLGAVGALLFGNTKTSTTLLDQGLAFNPGTYAQGVTGSTYADLATTKTRSLLGVAYSTKVSNSTVSGSLNGELLSQVNAVIKALGDGVLSAASVFGSEAAKAAESALGSAVVDLGKLSLKDLKPDEIAAVLQATFDKVGDQLAAAGVPGLDKLGQVGEGAFETLTRVAREYQVVDISLASIGKTFGAVGLESLAARDGLVQLLGGVEEFSSKTGFFAANFLTDAERLAPIQKAVNDNLAAYGLSAASTRDQFKALVLAQDLTTESGRNAYAALLNIAPAFDKVAKASEAATAAADELAKQTAEQQRQEAEAKIAKAKEVADAQASIQDRINQATLTSAELMYLGREKELKAADALDASLGPMLIKLWGFEDAATKAAEATAKAAEEFERLQSNQTTNIGLMRQLMAMDDAVTGGNSALLAMREDELAKLDDTGKYLQKIIWARQDEQKIIDANTAALEKENARRAELTNRQTAIQDEIDKLTLSSSDLLLKTRAKERAEAVAFDASLGPLLDSLYALQDAASATAAANEAAAAAAAAAAEEAQRAAELYSSRMSKVADLLTASGQNTLATLFQRSQELSRIVDPVSRALQLQIYAAQDLADQIGAARDTLTASYERESGAIEAFRDKLVGVGDSLRDYSASLGSTLSGSASASSQRAQAEAAFRDIVTRYQQGDVSLAGQIPALGEAFARASQAASKDQLSYLRDIAYIKAETDQAASKVDSQVTIAAQQLDQLKAQVSGLINVEAATMTVAQAVTNLTDLVRQTTYGQDARAQAIQDQINGMQSPFSLIWTLLGSKAALAAGLPQYTGANDNIPGFAAGGVFTNGIVSQPTMFNMAQMGEAGSEAIVPLVRGPEGLGVRMSGGGNAEMVAELRALRKEVAELKAAQIQTTINTGRQVRLAERWDGDGLPPERSVAA